MDDQFCPNCGTEVEADARFCPTCGTTLVNEASTGEADAELPAAPAWPPPQSQAETPADEPPTMTDAPAVSVAPPESTSGPMTAEPAAPAGPPGPGPSIASQSSAPPPAPAQPAAPQPAAPQPPGGPAMDLPITWPTTLSGWLIGAGSLLGAIFLIPRLGGAGYIVSLVLFLALLGIAATVFLADRVPAIPRLRLVVLVTTLIGLGVALARAAFSIAGVDTLFLVAMLAAAGGALLIELDRDRPMPPAQRSGG
jgi:hypothetical protein